MHKQNNNYHFYVKAGMRFSQPFIAEVIQEIADHIEYIIGIIMSPQYSPIIMSGYIHSVENAVKMLHHKKIHYTIAKDWHMQLYFIQALTERVQEALHRFPPDIRKHISVLFSAHSMPKRVIDKDPDYINQLKETAAAVAQQAGLPTSRWMFCYQSAGHTPEEWLKPDFADIMPQLNAKGQKHILIAPVQFLSDHLEILYDIDIAAREQAEKYGIQFARITSLNISPVFIKALAAVVKNEIDKNHF